MCVWSYTGDLRPRLRTSRPVGAPSGTPFWRPLLYCSLAPRGRGRRGPCGSDIDCRPTGVDMEPRRGDEIVAGGETPGTRPPISSRAPKGRRGVPHACAFPRSPSPRPKERTACSPGGRGSSRLRRYRNWLAGLMTSPPPPWPAPFRFRSQAMRAAGAGRVPMPSASRSRRPLRRARASPRRSSSG